MPSTHWKMCLGSLNEVLDNVHHVKVERTFQIQSCQECPEAHLDFGILKSDEIGPNTQVYTRQHSTRMHTARLETAHASVSVATTRRCSGGRGVRSPNKQV